ncbi:hypothetical protein D3C75_1230180 [compost metagenome]
MPLANPAFIRAVIGIVMQFAVVNGGAGIRVNNDEIGVKTRGDAAFTWPQPKQFCRQGTGE